jgi:exosortase A-associated hydrolase 2
MPDDRIAPIQLDAFYISLEGRRRFCILHSPRGSGDERRTIVYVHPFGEEMNKSRRMAALQARALAQSGFTVLQIDLLGCGDSEGHFHEASWTSWVNDVVAAARWLRERVGSTAWLWGLRSGCLVAVEAGRLISPAPDQLFWQPVISGNQYLQHLLRMRLAAQLMSPADGKRTDTRELRAQFAQGRTIEIAGYEVSPALAGGLDAADLAPPPGSVRVEWFEIASAAGSDLSPAALARADAWRRAGHRVATRVVAGPSFWQTQEITECPALIAATLTAVDIAQ